MADNAAGQTLTKGSDQGTPGFASGKIVFDATTITATEFTRVVTGFKPRYVRLQASSGVSIEWFEGMTDNTCFKSAAAGGNTLETTNGGITVDSQGFRVLQNATLVAILAPSTVYYTAHV